MDFHNSVFRLPAAGTGSVFAVGLILLTIVCPGSAQSWDVEHQKSAEKNIPHAIAKYTSRHFLIHTDLPPSEANKLLCRLEVTLARISKYWGRHLRDPIECYIVNHLENWRDSDFPHKFARTLVAGVGGGAYAKRKTIRGKQKVKIIVYCTSRPGTAEHEIVHAYWGQTIGTSAPKWYHEGMAEVAYQNPDNRGEITCAPEVIQFLREGSIRTSEKVVNSPQNQLELTRSLERLLERSSTITEAKKIAQLRDWVRTHGESVRLAREQYRWYWSLCHFLNHNSNYSSRFRTLGKQYLSHHPKSFQQLFGSMRPEIDFEYRFFLDRIDSGYDVELCRWDWKRKFFDLNKGQRSSIRVKASAGFQASGLYVMRGQSYSYQCDGSWRISKKGTDLTADGNLNGQGRLVGVIMTGYELSKPIEFGVNGSFKAPREGKLFLRCRDGWNELAGNDGSIVAQFRILDSNIEK